MDPNQSLMRGAKAASEAVGSAVRSVRRTPWGRIARNVGEAIERPMRYLRAAAPGLAYRYRGAQPDPDVGDDVIADRVRSGLGPVTKRLDLPRVHVMVEDHVALLHGEVASGEQARLIEAAAMRVSGVIGVESHLHLGLIAGDTRPKEGNAPMPSDAMIKLMDAAASAGAHDARAAVHAVLCGFADRLPENERRHVFTHLPEDVRQLAGPPQRIGVVPASKVKTVRELVAAVIAQGGIQPSRAGEITQAVVHALRMLVPEEDRDVAAVLPQELRVLWEAAPVG